MSLHQRYIEQLQKSGFESDVHQVRVLASLECLVSDLQQRKRSAGRLWFKRRNPVKGVYIWGGVGRGKTWLMDLFIHYTHDVPIERHHFHSFMRQIHQRLQHREGEKAPLALIAAEMSQRMQVLCLDEFNVIDIGDAMLLRGLLEALEKSAITLVTTSNLHPDDLYPMGIQRESFLPAIDILKRNNQVMELTGKDDYRLRLFKASSVYHAPLSGDAGERMSLEFHRLVSGEVEIDGEMKLPGKAIPFLKRANGVIWFDFNVLCGPPRWQNDYLELARCYHTVFISGIPNLVGTMDDHARRFIHLVDIFYDRKVNLVISAEDQPERLYAGTRLAFEFQRTTSRLKEMQSAAYLETPHIG